MGAALDKKTGRIQGYFERPLGKVTLGIDGIVDEVWQIVASRTGPDEYELYGKMKAFTQALYECGEGGFSNEIVRKRLSYGGFTANTGKAVRMLGAKPVLLGMFGDGGKVHKVFEEFDTDSGYRLFNVGSAPVCHIFEFGDGKIIFPWMQDRNRFNWESLAAAMPREAMDEAFGGTDVLGLGYWSSMQAFDSIVSKLCGRYGIKRMFFDFADIRKRSRQALDQTLQLLKKLNEQVPMTLSLNENEAELLYSGMGRAFAPESAELDTAYIRQQIGLDELIVHTPYFAVASSVNEGTALSMQRHCENPVITTGAGDNFNGGYIVASSVKGCLPLSERLLVGNAVTAFYVRCGHSPDKEGLFNELNNY
jgi:sugar/nucleoside kinase (ribokinase family)